MSRFSDLSTLRTCRLAADTLRKFVSLARKIIENRLLFTLPLNWFVQGPSDRVNMSLKALTDDEKTELKEQFCVLDKEESGFINLNELKDALDLAGFKVPGWRVRDMIDKIDRDTATCQGGIVGQRKLSYGEFEHVSENICKPHHHQPHLSFPALLRAQVQGGVSVLQDGRHQEGQYQDTRRDVSSQC